MIAPMSTVSSSGSPMDELLQRRGEFGDERVEDRGVEEQARTRRARLPLARHTHPGDDTLHGLLLIGVRKDDRRTLAAEFERDRHDPIGGGMHD
jgi:hypothetical protein